MALVRVPIPSPNHSGNRPSNRLLVVHTSEGAQDFRSLGNFLAQASSQVSYNVGFDNTTASQIGEYVAPPLTPWAAMSANSWGAHGCCCTPSGASQGWSRDTWLGQDTMLRACAAWLAEEAARYGVPLVKLDANDIQAGRAGVCGHGDCSAAGAGGDHTDPGPNFPWDVVLAYATGAAPTPPPPPEEEDMLSPAVAVGSDGRQYVFWKGTDGNLWQSVFDGAAWGGPYNLGMGPLGSGPSVGVDGAGVTYVFWQGSDGNVWEAFWAGDKWEGPVKLGWGPLGKSA